MLKSAENLKNLEYSEFPYKGLHIPFPDIMSCNWNALQTQLIHQWPKLTLNELELVGPYRRRIAILIGEKYGITATLIEHYLRNFERTIYARLCLVEGYKQHGELENLQSLVEAQREPVQMRA